MEQPAGVCIVTHVASCGRWITLPPPPQKISRSSSPGPVSTLGYWQRGIEVVNQLLLDGEVILDYLGGPNVNQGSLKVEKVIKRENQRESSGRTWSDVEAGGRGRKQRNVGYF